MLSKIIHPLLVLWHDFIRPKGTLLRKQDDRDFELGLWGIGDYKPKNTRTDNAKRDLWIRDQSGQNTCVCESGASQKELDEGVKLSAKGNAIYLRKLGAMSSQGTSLSAYQKSLRDYGCNTYGLLDENHGVSWWKYSDPKVVTEGIKQDAAKHKIKSYWKTKDLNTVLKQLDEGKPAQGALAWYTGYNSGSISSPYIIKPFSGYYVGGHAIEIMDYDLDYHGQKVLKVKNSYSEKYGNKGYFYVRFSDFDRVLGRFGCYYNDDLHKDVIGWLSIHSGRAIKEKNSPKIWYIQADKKRYIPDEALLTMLGFNPTNLIVDTENMLVDVKEGEPVSLEDIPMNIREQWKYNLSELKDLDFLERTFKKYFPTLFNK